uniref:Uncharacterized protein LOC108950033 n=1 Tax=Phallusia mammillata TaxID=59560 RepID=A0A6F9DJ98_9ASCI|nr:uncharacterized protein LOC108950033 [Phallusia mammillata]
MKDFNFEHYLYPTRENCTVVFTCCRYDILTNILHNGNARSFLMSDRVINIKKTIVRIKALLEVLQPQNDKKYSMFYQTEQRNLPQESTNKTKTVPQIQKEDGAGDQIRTSTSKSLPTTEEAGDQEMGPDAALKELFVLLIKPLDVNKVETGSSICIMADDFLAEVPFDQLIDTSSQKPLGETFHIFTTPCFLALNNNKCNDHPKSHGKSSGSIREQKLAETFHKPSELFSLQTIGIAKDLSGLVTSSATGVSVMTSPRYVTPHKRVPFPLKTSVIGGPVMPAELKYENTVWKPKKRMTAAVKECNKIAEYLNVDAMTGEEATKDKFLSEFSEVTLMHVTTYADLSKGVLAFKPNSFPAEDSPYSPLSYLVTLQDFIERKPSNLQLMVISSGHGWTNTDVKLPQILLTAGVACVVYLRWPVPDCVAEKFFFHFYMNLQKSCKVSRALFNAKEATRERYPDYTLWNAFTATGSDVTIDLSRIRQSQLQNRLNDVESPVLDTPPFIDEVVSDEERFHLVQEALSRLGGSVSGDSDVISFLLGLVEEATERLTSDDNVDRPIVILPKAVENVDGTVDLLSLMGFDLQPIDSKSLPPTSDRSHGADKMIVFPHWNQDSLLLPCHQALIGLHELCQNPECLRMMALMLPLQQELLSYLIDLLSIVHHTPEVQLRTTDASVRELWQQRAIRRSLKEIGISNVMDLVFFSRSLMSRSCLLASLQFLTSFSLHRDQSVLEQLDVTSLGKIPQTESAEDPIKLDSLNLALLPRNEVAVKSSWMGDDSFEKEKKERKKLADDIRKLSEKYSQALEHAKWWHRDVRVPQQAGNSLVSQDSALNGGDQPTHPRKVKVQSGATPSCNRLLLDDNKQQSGLLETLSRRSEARIILQRRCDDLNRRHTACIRDTYLRYAEQKSVQ